MDKFEAESTNITLELFTAFVNAGKKFKENVCERLEYNESYFYYKIHHPKHTDLSVTDRELFIYIAEKLVKEISFVIKVQKEELASSISFLYPSIRNVESNL